MEMGFARNVILTLSITFIGVLWWKRKKFYRNIPEISHTVSMVSAELNISEIEDSDNTVNILLMGESGVGKSTFINSFANYIKSKSFEDATCIKTTIIIPTRVTIYDDNTMEYRTIIVGSDENEKQNVGCSATQGVKTYLFPIENENRFLRIIDTPGFGDTEGSHQDDKNCEGILAFLAQLKKLNGICLVMKPTNDRNTVFFSYCVRRILSQLHKSATDNVIFVFTNTKGSDYTPGNTLPILKNMADTIAAHPPHVKIPIKKHNVFCLDNECLKYLLALENRIKVNRHTIKSCKVSWKIACKEMFRFIKYIQSIKPHNVQQTLSINSTRELILQLSKPLSDLCQLLQNNIVNLQEKEIESEKTDQTIEELNKILFKPGLDLEIEVLNSSVLVCTDFKCAEKIQVGGTTKFNFKKKCHDPCLVGFLAYEILGHWTVRTCTEMNFDNILTSTCKHCKCSHQKHMIIFYDTKVVEKQSVNKDIQKNIQSEEKEREKINNQIKKIKAEKKELEEEQEFIGMCAAKFAYYLQNNSITSSYDHFKEYIYLSLEREKSLGKDANLALITNLTQVLQRHEDLIKTLNDKKFLVDGKTITEESVYKDVEKLFTLKHSGKKIKQIFDARASCVKNKAKLNLTTVISISNKIPNWFIEMMKKKYIWNFNFI